MILDLGDFLDTGKIVDQALTALFHISDLTDLIPSRFLEMQLDARPTPNLLGTSIENNYLGELAWRIDLGYDVPVYERVRDRGLREVNLYTLIGLLGKVIPVAKIVFTFPLNYAATWAIGITC